MSNYSGLHLGVMLPGAGNNRSSWRHPGVPRDAATDFGFYLEQTLLAESGKFDFVFLADHPYISPDSPPILLNRFEPLTILSALAVTTSRIGLAATASVSFTEPFNVARQFASLDQLSKGRAAWNVVTTGYEEAAKNFSRSKHYDHAERYRLAIEHLDVVRGLWDSWEEGAFVQDRESGQFYDRDKLHILDHKGEFFQVKGPLNVGPSKQGQPVIFQAGSSDTGRDLAASSADAIFTNPADFEEGKAFYQDIKNRTVARGRSRDSIKILPGITPVVGRTDEEARAKYDEIVARIDPREAVKDIAIIYPEIDLLSYPIDGPFPDLGEIGRNGYRSTTDRWKRLSLENNWTLGDLAVWYNSPKGNFVGSAQTVADLFQKWFEGGAADGFIIRTASPDGLRDIVELLVPELQRRGLFRNDYEGDTLRSHLGLEKPVNRHRAVTPARAAG